MNELLGPVAVLLSLIGQTPPDVLVGPYAGLALSLFLNGLFYSGKVLSRTVVRREDFDASQAIIASYAEAIKALTTSLDEAITTMNLIQRGNGR